MSILPKPLFSVRIQFYAHIFNTPRNWKRLIQEIKISRGKFRKATQIALRWLWRSWGLLRGDSSFYSALKFYLQQRGFAVWPLMELTEEEPHALSVQYHGLTESHNSSLLITSGARLVFAILNWQFLHLRKLTPPPLVSSWTCLVLTVHFCVDRVLHCAHFLINKDKNHPDHHRYWEKHPCEATHLLYLFLQGSFENYLILHIMFLLKKMPHFITENAGSPRRTLLS